MRRACCVCQTPLDGDGAIAEPSKVSHGICGDCATNEHVKIDEMPKCGLMGPWGACNLFRNHVGGCRQLGE